MHCCQPYSVKNQKLDDSTGKQLLGSPASVVHNAYSLEPGKTVAVGRTKYIHKNQAPSWNEAGHHMVLMLHVI
jgi:hypothetical protein